MTSHRANGQAWRCCGCKALLGVHKGTELHIKYKDLEGVIVGAVRVTCRRCLTANKTQSSAA